MKKDSGLRESIIAAAVNILETRGLKALTQYQVARSVGIRQSHLTYYFRKRADLVQAIIRSHLDHANQDGATGDTSRREAYCIREALELLISNPARFRFFIGLIVEAGQDPQLRSMLDQHMEQFDQTVARYFGRMPGDRDVILFLSVLRGYGMRETVRDETKPPLDLDAVAERFGLFFTD